MSNFEVAMDYEQWLALPGEWVEPPNERRGGVSGVQRVYLDAEHLLYRKQQAGHIYRSFTHPLGYPTVMREYQALLDCQRLRVPVPEVVFASCTKEQGVWKALLLTESLEGFRSLEECYAEGEHRRWGEALHKEVLIECGRVLGRLNGGRRQHGCLYLKHIFVRVRDDQVDVALIDLEKSRRRLLRKQAARHDLRQIFRRAGWRGELLDAFLRGYQESFGPLEPLAVSIPPS